MNTKLKFFTAIALFSTCFQAHSELVWEQTEVGLHPAIGDETAVGHFKYQNQGDKTIAIKNVSTTCGCTAATTNKNGVAPGERGEITATFQIGNRVGLQEKLIVVNTDDPAHPSATLKLKVTIPQLLDFKPAFIFWQAGEAPTPKSIVARVGKDVAIKTLEVLSSDPNFVTKVEHRSVDEFQISVEPRQTAQAAGAVLTIKLTLPDGKSKLFPATARVISQSQTAVQGPANATAPNSANQPGKVAGTAIAGAKGDELDACALLSSAEIESVQGEPVKETKRNAEPEGYFAFSQCSFVLPTATKSVGLAVMQKMDDPNAPEPKQFWKETFHDEKKQQEGGQSPPAENIAGVGDEAFWVENRAGGQLYVLEGNRYIVISAGSVGDRAAKIKRAKELAQIVVKRLQM